MKNFIFSVLSVLLLAFSSGAQSTIIPYNATWKYLDNGTDQGTAWRSPSFSDGAWKTGTGKFGYGISDASTIVSFGPNSSQKYITTYFRKTITILNPAAFTYYEAYLKRDDGAVVYVNGTEVYRNTMPSGTITYTTLASASASDNGTTGQYFKIPNSRFVAGNNTIAVEIHQQSVSTPDMAFDFSLASPALKLDPVTIRSNNSKSTLAKPGDVVTLSFTSSEPINSPTVTIATRSATVTAGTNNTYTASYTMTTSDAEGKIPFTIDYTSKAGVTGNQVTTTTNNSSVTFDKTPPSVKSINRQNPTTETTNATSVTYRTTFSENVRGVDAPDFSLTTTSGSVTGAVSTVTRVSASVYDVSVSSISGSGTLRLDLKSTGTGISDAAYNAISGGFTAGQTYAITTTTPSPVYGFSSVTPLSTITVGANTEYKQQAKTWYYANKWWCVLNASDGTSIYRLDGTAWTRVLLLTSSGSRADCKVVGNLVHIFGVQSSSAFLYTVEYDAAAGKYKLWSSRTTRTNLTLPSGRESANIVVDKTGRMWAATAGTTDVTVWWSDAPYTTWSAPMTLVSGINDDDMCALVALPTQNKIGLFWSNQNTKRYGFRTHTDGASPGTWSADEVPASQSALDVYKGMADDHMSPVVASDGTLYIAAKTGYDTPNHPHLILLVRRPSGTWDNAHTVTLFDGTREAKDQGTAATLVLNEALGKVKVIHTTATYGGDIVYRESSTSSISFGAPVLLFSGTPNKVTYATTSLQPYNPDIVIMATDVSSSPQRVVSVLASDAATSSSSQFTTTTAAMELQAIDPDNQKSLFEAFPNPFTSNMNLSFQLPASGNYTIRVYDSRGAVVHRVDGWADAGQKYIRNLNTGTLAKGVYIVQLSTAGTLSTLKVLKL